MYIKNSSGPSIEPGLPLNLKNLKNLKFQKKPKKIKKNPKIPKKT